MIVGVPKEIKDNEYRVAMTPVGVSAVVGDGQRVLVQSGAGLASGFDDAEYESAGATIVPAAEDVWNGADLVVKVKEPIGPELELLREDLTLFTYLHLAAAREAASALLESGATGIAYETVQDDEGFLPLLAPMSEVAGRLAPQVGAHYLERNNGGSGVLLSGIPGVPPSEVVVLGAGVSGMNAAWVALGMGASVTLIDTKLEKLRHAEENLEGNLSTAVSVPGTVARAVAQADLVIGCVLVAGAAAPKVVSRKMIAAMRPGSVIVDIAVDQGGCIETTKPTSHSDPTYVEEGVVHYCVTNMPGAVPRTSTMGLTNSTLPYIRALAKRGVVDAVKRDPSLALGVNTYRGHVTHPAVAEALGVESRELRGILVS